LSDRSYRLLLLTPFAPRLDAPMGGSRVIAQLVTQLAARHEVALLCLRRSDEPWVDEKLRRRCSYVEEIVQGETAFRPARTGGSVPGWQDLQTWWGLLRGRPSWVTETATRRFSARLRKLTREWRPEVIQFEFHVMAQYLAAIADLRLPAILTQHDPGTAAARDAWRTGQARGRYRPRAEVAAWAAYEGAWLPRMNRVIVFTERDRAAVMEVAPAARSVTIPLSADLPGTPLNAVGMEPPTLLFYGNYIHSPNVRAALRLARNIFPPLAADRPDLTLELIGPNPPPELLAEASDTIRIPGFVPDVTPHLDQATAFIAPLDTGGGMRVKILEALAAGKPVIASPLAVEGLSIRHGRNVLLAETDADFIAAAHRLLADAVERERLGRAARGWAVRHLGWARVAECYGQVYEEVTSCRGNSEESSPA
jgi:polysaccharide biosynthesis protein PslH